MDCISSSLISVVEIDILVGGMTQFKNIHHLALICFDYEKSKQFYTEILGFQIIRETYRKERQSYKLDLRVNEQTQIELFSFPNSQPRLSYPEACGLRHLAFSVSNIQETSSFLISKGITVEDIRVDALTKKRYTFFKDPDGLPLELYEE